MEVNDSVFDIKTENKENNGIVSTKIKTEIGSLKSDVASV